MIRVIVRNYWKSETGDAEETRTVDFPGCNGSMPFMGPGSGMTAVVKVSKTNPAQGPHEVVAVISSADIVKLEEVPDEG